jgi:hypothetical protein
MDRVVPLVPQPARNADVDAHVDQNADGDVSVVREAPRCIATACCPAL